MMAKLNSLTILVLVSYLCNGSLGRVAPDFIHICPGLTSECLKKTIQDTIPHFIQGIPEFGITSIDPIVSDHITINLPGLKVEMFDTRITGIRKCSVDHVKYENKHADIDIHCRLIVKGKYRAHGSLLIMQINGDGDAKLKVSNVSLHAKINFEDKVRNGTVYHEIQDITFTHKFDDRVIFELTNLFKGSPQISEIVSQFMNDNWQIIVDEFGDPIVKIVVDYVVANIKKFFSAIPKDEIIVYNK